MNEIEAVQILKDHIVGWQANKEYAFKFYRAVGVAITALREKAEMGKGCVWCNENNKVYHDGQHFHFFCSYCGRRLEVEHGR